MIRRLLIAGAVVASSAGLLTLRQEIRDLQQIVQVLTPGQWDVAKTALKNILLKRQSQSQ